MDFLVSVPGGIIGVRLGPKFSMMSWGDLLVPENEVTFSD
jgi:hypothetical protein